MNKLQAIFLLSLPFLAVLCFERPVSALQSTLKTSSHFLTVSHNPVIKHKLNQASSSISVKHNIPGGYKLFLSMASHDPNGNRLYLQGNASSPYFIAPTTTTRLGYNTWGYSLTGENDDFHAVPVKTANPALIHQTNSADPQYNRRIPIFYFAKTNLTLPPGVYRGTVLYTALAEVPPDTLNLSPILTKKLSGGELLTITTPLMTNMNPHPASQPITVSIGGATCEELKLVSTSPLTFTCKAPARPVGKYDITVSVPKFSKTYVKQNALEYVDPRAFGGITKMQEMTPEVCRKATTPLPTAINTTTLNTDDKNRIPEVMLIDTRDNNTYRVRKLADGNCWMAQNLNLRLRTNQTLTPENTDLNTNWTPLRNTQSYDIDGSWSPLDQSRSREARSGHGVYYSWNAATAGSGWHDHPEGMATSSSICPKGWKLPSASGNSSFYNLSSYYNNYSQTLMQAARIILSGYHSYNGSIRSEGLSGYYWNNQMINAENRMAGVAYFYRPSIIKSDHEDQIHFGFTVRCVVSPDREPTEIKYLQEMTPNICAKMSEHQALNLVDSRDNKVYGIKKLKNGNCWFTKNLELILDTTKSLSYGGSDLLKIWQPPRNTERTSGGLPNWNNEGTNQSDQTQSYIEDNPGNHGVYYNWNAATAGRGNTAFVAPEGTEKVLDESICPRGWKLPHAGTGNSSYSNMKALYPDVFVDGPNLIKSGYYSIGAGGLHSVDTSAYYWTNTTRSEYSEGRISALTFTGRDTYSNQPRKYGFNIRCVSR